MSEQYEPSYYEIALTGRQVLVAFVILLICLVAAFFSGVWVGRGGPARIGQAQAQLRDEAEARVPGQGQPEGGERAAGAEASSGDAGASVPEQEGVDALSFFDEEAETGRAPAESAEPAKAAPQAATAEPPAEPAGGSEGPAANEAAGESGGSAEAAPERPRETVNPSGALTGGDVVIQVFSSSDQAKAQEILDRLKANDFRAFISPVTDDGRTLYRVRVGPFEHQDDAERVAAELRRRLDLDTWITR